MSHGGARKGAGRPKGRGQYGEQTKPIRLPLSLIDVVMKFVENKGFKLPLYGSKVSAGCPLPAEDDIEKELDITEYLIKEPSTTFFVRVSGLSMIEAGIHENDILVVDKNIPPVSGKIVVVAIDGHLTVKRLHKDGDTLFLMPENKAFTPIEVKEGNEIHVFGVVTNVIHSL